VNNITNKQYNYTEACDLHDKYYLIFIALLAYIDMNNKRK
jgi:hypothetical protein